MTSALPTRRAAALVRAADVEGLRPIQAEHPKVVEVAGCEAKAASPHGAGAASWMVVPRGRRRHGGAGSVR